MVKVATPKSEKIVKFQDQLAIKAKYEVNILPTRQNHKDAANFRVKMTQVQMVRAASLSLKRL